MKEIVEKLIEYHEKSLISTPYSEVYIKQITVIVLRNYLKYLTGGKKTNG